jgi:hypothetical protein
MGGTDQLLVGQARLLQLLRKLPVLLDAVTFQQGNLLLRAAKSRRSASAAANCELTSDSRDDTASKSASSACEFRRSAK